MVDFTDDCSVWIEEDMAVPTDIFICSFNETARWELYCDLSNCNSDLEDNNF